MRRFHSNQRRGGAFRPAPIGIHEARLSSLIFSTPDYRADDYPVIRSRMFNAPRSTRRGILPILPPTYDEWRSWAEQQFRSWRRRGTLIVPIIIEPEVFFDWCATRRLPINTESAETFAHERQAGAERVA